MTDPAERTDPPKDVSLVDLVDPAEQVALAGLVGAPIAAIEPLRWGFTHQTRLVTLEDGRRLAVKRLTGPGATQEVNRAAAIAPRLAAAGIPTPTVFRFDAGGAPPTLVTAFVEGAVGADWLDTPERAALLAHAMGGLVQRLADVDSVGLPAPETWSSPDRLTRAARSWLASLRSTMDGATAIALEQAIDAVPQSHAGVRFGFAHGDFVPVNALLDTTGALSALLDLGSWRIAHPWFDAAWWGWVVRFHHPDAWAAAWPVFLGAAGIPDDLATSATIATLQRLRALELATGNPDWLERLKATADWS